MTTTLDTRSPVSFWIAYTWASISPTVRFRTRPPMPEAQNLQPMRQPTWEEIQTESPWWYCIHTLSTTCRSDRAKRNFFVPSIFDVCTRSACSGHSA